MLSCDIQIKWLTWNKLPKSTNSLLFDTNRFANHQAHFFEKLKVKQWFPLMHIFGQNFKDRLLSVQAKVRKAHLWISSSPPFPAVNWKNCMEQLLMSRPFPLPNVPDFERPWPSPPSCPPLCFSHILPSLSSSCQCLNVCSCYSNSGFWRASTKCTILFLCPLKNWGKKLSKFKNWQLCPKSSTGVVAFFELLIT